MDATKGDAMGKTVLPAAVLTVMLAATLVLAAPAYPQAASSGNPAANEEGNLAAPRPPEYQVTEDGGLIIGGDIRGDCAAIGRADPTERFADPSARVQMERADNEAARACEAAGFSTAADGVSSSALPETGGAPPLPLAGLLLLAGVVGLVALRRTG